MISKMQQAAKLQGDLKSYQFAVEYLKKIESNNSQLIAANSRYVRAYVGRGISKYELKDYSGAISDYRVALSVDPQYASAYFNLGLAKDKLKDINGAISDMQQAVKLYQQQGKQRDAQNAIDQIKKWHLR